MLDLLLWWLGEPAEFTYKDDALDGLEANALLNASFSEGITVTVRLSRDWETMNTYTFQFDRATVILRVNKANQTELTFDDLPMTFAAELREPFSAGSSSQTPPLDTNSQAFIAQLIDVIGSIQGCRPPRVGGTEGIRAIRWIESCYACRQSLGTSWLKELRTKDTCVSR